MLDALDASLSVDADRFLTADRTFHRVLHQVTGVVPRAAQPLLVDRSLPGALSELGRVLAPAHERGEDARATESARGADGDAIAPVTDSSELCVRRPSPGAHATRITRRGASDPS